MRKVINAILIFCLIVPSTRVMADETPIAFPETVAVEDAEPISFSDSLFETSKSKAGKGHKDEAFFCKDSKQFVSSFDADTLLSRYLFFFKKGNAKGSTSNIEMCAIYYRERYARNLFEVAVENGKVLISAKQMEERYLKQLENLKKLNQGNYSSDGKMVHVDRTDLKAIKELVSVVQEYWLTRFITYAYLEKSRDFALKGVGGVALTLGSVAGLVYFMAPRWADLAMKVPRLILNLGMLARNTLVTSVGSGLGASFAVASEIPDQYDVNVWPSPISVLNFPKDKMTIDTENVEKNKLLKEAYAIGGSVVAGYVGWHLIEIGAHKAAGTEFVKLLLEGIKRSGGLTKQVFFEAISALEMTSAAEKTIVVMNAIKNSETMAFFVRGYEALHLTSAIGSLIITDIMIHYLSEWIRETSTEELQTSYAESQIRFQKAVQNLKADPNNSDLSLQVFTSAQKMFESLRLLASHLLIPAYQSVVAFSDEYRADQTIPMTCNIAKMNVALTGEHKVSKFLDTLQKKEKDNYLMAANSIEQFEATVNDTGLYFFANFFKRKLSLLKISFFFDEKFGLETKRLSEDRNLKEFGKGYVKVLQGELAVNLQRMGSRLYEAIEVAKKDLGKSADSENILSYLSERDYVNALLYQKCLKLETTNPAIKYSANQPDEGFTPLHRWRIGN